MVIKQTRSDAGTSERVETEAKPCQEITSINNFTMRTPHRQISISDFLAHGQENAVPLRHLQEIVHLSGRAIRKKIETERRSGILILSDNFHGYYLADSQAEVEQFVSSMLRRSKEIAKTALTIKKAAGLSSNPPIPGQIALNEDG